MSVVRKETKTNASVQLPFSFRFSLESPAYGMAPYASWAGPPLKPLWKHLPRHPEMYILGDPSPVVFTMNTRVNAQACACELSSPAPQHTGSI